jgi:hypothetical protein
MHAAKTETADAATIGMAARARDAKGMGKSGEGAENGTGASKAASAPRYLIAASIFCMRSISVV